MEGLTEVDDRYTCYPRLPHSLCLINFQRNLCFISSFVICFVGRLWPRNTCWLMAILCAELRVQADNCRCKVSANLPVFFPTFHPRSLPCIAAQAFPASYQGGLLLLAAAPLECRKPMQSQFFLSGQVSAPMSPQKRLP